MSNVNSCVHACSTLAAVFCRRKQEVPEAKGGVNEGWGHGNEHVNLFPAPEQKGSGNAEYLAEQQTLELHKQRREGNAPVALGRDPTGI
jgi:hypothetical protein